MYNYFMIIGTLAEDFCKVDDDRKSSVKVMCRDIYNTQILPVNVIRCSGSFPDFMYKGDLVIFKGRIEFDNKGNLELLANRAILKQKIERNHNENK